MRLIDAEEIKKKIKDHPIIFRKLYSEDVIELLDAAPTVVAEPVRQYAHWIKWKDEDGTPYWQCSGCKKEVDTNPYYYVRCPFCGAKMAKHTLKCPSYLEQDGGRCLGTKEVDRCSCNGNKKNCDFYQKVRDEE